MTDTDPLLDRAGAAALAIAAEGRWAEATLRDLAEQAGLDLAALYGRARSKADIVDALDPQDVGAGIGGRLNTILGILHNDRFIGRNTEAVAGFQIDLRVGFRTGHVFIRHGSVEEARQISLRHHHIDAGTDRV